MTMTWNEPRKRWDNDKTPMVRVRDLKTGDEIYSASGNWLGIVLEVVPSGSDLQKDRMNIHLRSGFTVRGFDHDVMFGERPDHEYEVRGRAQWD